MLGWHVPTWHVLSRRRDPRYRCSLMDLFQHSWSAMDVSIVFLFEGGRAEVVFSGLAQLRNAAGGLGKRPPPGGSRPCGLTQLRHVAGGFGG